MSSYWADISLNIYCNSKEEAAGIVKFINECDNNWLPIKAEISSCDPEGKEIFLYLTDSEVYSSFDDDLVELWEVVYERFGKKLVGRILEDGGGWKTVSEFNDEGKLETEGIDFLEDLSIEQIRKVRAFVEELKESEESK